MKFEFFGIALGLCVTLVLGLVALLGQETNLLWSAEADKLVQELVFGVGCVVLVSVVIAAIQIAGGAQSLRLKASLCTPRYRPLYERATGYVLPKARAWAGISEPSSTNHSVITLLRNAFTYRLLDRAMLLAVIYPFIILLLFWGLTGSNGALGQTILIPAVDDYWKGPATLAVIAFVTGAQLYVKRISKHLRTPWKTRADHALGLVAFGLAGLVLGSLRLPYLASAIAFAIVFALTLASFLALGFIFVGPFAVVVIISVAVLVTFVVTATAIATAAFAAFAFACAFAFALVQLFEKNKSRAAAILAIAVPASAIVAAVAFIPWQDANDRLGLITAVFLFLAVAPLINALFDVVSYGVTIALTEKGRHGFPWFWGLIDVVIALVLFLALGSTLVCVVAGMERIAGVEFVDVGSLLAAAGDFSQYWWLYLILFSTALPTLAHLCLVGLSLQAHYPKKHRTSLCDMIDAARSGDQRASVLAPFAVGLVWTSGLVVVFGSIGGLVALFWNHGIERFVLWYRDWLLDVAVWAGAL